MKIWTIGHSNHSWNDFVDILQAYKIKHVLDIRSLPGSRKYPYFNLETLTTTLPAIDIKYSHITELGGYRKIKNMVPESLNSAWHNASFHNYADYMQTDNFISGLHQATAIAGSEKSVLMCAEAVPWRCHRSLVADALLVRGWEVIDIFSKTNSKLHKITKFASVQGQTITYPPENL